jgi:hypothetical protein
MRVGGVAWAMALLAVTPVGASQLCQKKSSGVLVVREACKKRESPLDLAQFGAPRP